MKNLSNNIYNLAKKKMNASLNPQVKKFNDLRNKNDFNNKKELKGYQNNDSKRKIRQSVNYNVSKVLKNKFDVNENEEYISKYQKKDFKVFKSKIENNNEIKENKKDEKNQNIFISSINEIRLPRKLMDISYDLIFYE